MAWFEFLQPAAGRQRRVLPALLLTFSWQELRHHPWRHAAAVVAVMLGFVGAPDQRVCAQ